MVAQEMINAMTTHPLLTLLAGVVLVVVVESFVAIAGLLSGGEAE